jgi:two-component system response regulator NreC
MADTGVFLVDDHKMIREGLKSLIATEPGLRVVGEAASGEDALDAYLDICPDVVIMDVNLPGIDGVETTRRLMNKDPNARIVGLSMYADNQTARSLREAGCLGFITKSAPFKDLVLAIRTASAGLTFPDDDYVGAKPSDATPKEDIGLTLREQEVLSLIGQGLSAEELATQMDVSVSTIASHRRNIMSKLRLHSGLGGAN